MPVSLCWTRSFGLFCVAVAKGCMSLAQPLPQAGVQIGVRWEGQRWGWSCSCRERRKTSISNVRLLMWIHVVTTWELRRQGNQGNSKMNIAESPQNQQKPTVPNRIGEGEIHASQATATLLEWRGRFRAKSLPLRVGVTQWRIRDKESRSGAASRQLGGQTDIVEFQTGTQWESKARQTAGWKLYSKAVK